MAGNQGDTEMPTYTYGCKSCGHEFDVFHSISATPKIACESCDSTKVERHLGTGGCIIFKGSGFYETDFKGKKGTKPASESNVREVLLLLKDGAWKISAIRMFGSDQLVFNQGMTF